MTRALPDAAGLDAAPRDSAEGIGPALAALIAGAVAMGISPIFVRVVSPEIGPFASAFWRVALALPALLAWMRWEEARRPALRGHWLAPSALLAGLAFAGDLFFWHRAILGTTVANATFFATTAPVFVVLFAWLGLGRRPGGRMLAGLALCLAGGAALVGQSVQVDPGRLAGDRDGLVTAVFFALYFLFVERARARGLGAARVTFVATGVTALVLLAVALVAGGPLLPRTGTGVAALLALALLSHVGGQGLLSVALGRLPAGFSSLVIFLEAVAAAALGWLILGEAITPAQGLGGGLILFGIVVARPRRSRS
ncbi:DMT family transporter [Methylobacterium oryzihabitans]|uniref:DMT family transporter n=1 Tax=Methylobacterium oryzihabitans TaxID=2499852 RepID=A0A3S2V6R7_9HYPH|nr:DMT family transporter [Methylobacterium oryzihabitans]RVU15768.1 DMT family transporter [Methylobacterium oryzihabitans]